MTSVNSLYDDVIANLAKREKLEESIIILDNLLAEKQDEVSALYLLGNAHVIKGQFAIAEKFFQLANEKRPNHAAIVNGLGCVAMELLKHEEAIELFKKTLELQPDDALVYNNLATCYVHLGDPEEGIKWAELAYSKDKSNPETEHNLSQCLLGLGKWGEAFSHYDARLLLPDRAERFYTADHSDKYWDGTKGINLLVHGEQGLGDEIMFASVLPDAIKDCNVIYDCNYRLLNLMRDSFPDIPIYGTKQQNGMVEWYSRHQIDAKISIGSLCKFYRKDDASFPKTPYLKADSSIVERYKKKMASNKPKIGISWYGGAKRTSHSYRFNPLANWLDILKLDCDFYSLQYNQEAKDKIDKFNNDNGTKIIHWQDALDDYDETAGLISNLDLIITAPQSVAHLAGALGVKCWRLCAKQALWTHGVYGKDAPWYESVKNYWQQDNGEWQPLMKQIYKDLISDYPVLQRT